MNSFTYKGYDVFCYTAKDKLNAYSRKELRDAAEIAKKTQAAGHIVDHIEGRAILGENNDYFFEVHGYPNGDDAVTNEAIFYGFMDNGDVSLRYL